MIQPATRVVAAVIEREGRVLVAQRAPKNRHGGMWEFPGGKVERGESDIDALKRELLEELGLRLIRAEAPLAELHDPGSQFLIVFLPVVVDGQPECREHAATFWAAWRDLPDMPLAPTDARFVDQVISRQQT